MLKKAAISVGVFAISAFAAGTVAFAQTATPTTNTTNSTTNVTTSPTTAPSTTMPSGAPSTGRGN
jgi:hypothetical protein